MEAKTLGDFISIYQNFAKSENKSPRTIETVTAAVEKFDSFLGGSSNPYDIKAEDLRRYILDLQSRPRWSQHPTIKRDHGNLSPSSIACYVRSIRSFWSWMTNEGFTENNTFSCVKPPRETIKVVDPLTPQEVSAVIRTIPLNTHRGYRESCIIAALYGTASRVTEILDLEVPQIDFNSGQIKVMGKGARERSLFLSPKLYKALYKYQSRWRPKVASNYFFIHEDGSKLSRCYLEHRVQAFVGESVIGKPCTPHILRYSAAIKLLRNGCDPFTLQMILGHSTPKMTQRYVKIADSDVERQMKSFSPVEQLDITF